MHFNVYVDDQIGAELNQLAKTSGKTRNALIRQALAEWLQQTTKPEWPRAILSYKGIKDSLQFESYRSELLPLKEDPFA